METMKKLLMHKIKQQVKTIQEVLEEGDKPFGDYAVATIFRERQKYSSKGGGNSSLHV